MSFTFELYGRIYRVTKVGERYELVRLRFEPERGRWPSTVPVWAPTSATGEDWSAHRYAAERLGLPAEDEP